METICLTIQHDSAANEPNTSDFSGARQIRRHATVTVRIGHERILRLVQTICALPQKRTSRNISNVEIPDWIIRLCLESVRRGGRKRRELPSKSLVNTLAIGCD